MVENSENSKPNHQTINLNLVVFPVKKSRYLLHISTSKMPPLRYETEEADGKDFFPGLLPKDFLSHNEDQEPPTRGPEVAILLCTVRSIRTLPCAGISATMKAQSVPPGRWCWWTASTVVSSVFYPCLRPMYYAANTYMIGNPNLTPTFIRHPHSLFARCMKRRGKAVCICPQYCDRPPIV